jgi:hypothetical protein
MESCPQHVRSHARARTHARVHMARGMLFFARDGLRHALVCVCLWFAGDLGPRGALPHQEQEGARRRRRRRRRMLHHLVSSARRLASSAHDRIRDQRDAIGRHTSAGCSSGRVLMVVREIGGRASACALDAICIPRVRVLLRWRQHRRERRRLVWGNVWATCAGDARRA